MPCCAMKRFKLLFAMCAGVGRQTISPPNSNVSIPLSPG